MNSKSYELLKKELANKKYDPLTKDEEADFLRLKDYGIQVAFEKLICANLRLVAKYAHRYKKYDVPIEELFSVGVLGLIKAIQKHNYKYDTRLSTLAHFYINEFIKRELMNDRVVRLPKHLVTKISKVKKLIEEDEIGVSEYTASFYDQMLIAWAQKPEPIHEAKDYDENQFSDFYYSENTLEIEDTGSYQPDNEISDEMIKRLECLSKEQFDLLLLYSHMSLIEMSKVLQKPVKTVKKEIELALTNVRANLRSTLSITNKR